MPVSMWMDFRAVLASNLLEAELRAAFARERQEFDAEVLSRIEWILPDRPLGAELGRAPQADCLRGADLWHIATALYVAPRAEEMGFVTLYGPQRKSPQSSGSGRDRLADCRFRIVPRARPGDRPARSFVKCTDRSYSLSGAAGIKAGSPGTPGAPQS